MGFSDKYQTKAFTIEVQEGQFFVTVNAFGAANLQDIEKSIELITEAITQTEHQFLLIEASQIRSLPWKSRGLMYNALNRLFEQKKLIHLCIVNPNPYVRTIGFLAGRLYKEIDYSYQPDYESAVAKFRLYSSSAEHQVEVEAIRQALKKGKSTNSFKILNHLTYSSGDGHLSSFLVEPNLIIQKVSGDLNVEIAKAMVHEVHAFNTTSGSKCVYFGDVSAVRRLSRDTRAYFNSIAVELEKAQLRKFYRFPAFIVPFFKIYSYVNPAFASTTILVQDIEEAVFNYLKDQLRNKDAKDDPIGALDHSSFEEFDREELIEYLLTYHKKYQAMRQNVDQHIDDLFKVLSSITWSEDYSTRVLKIDDPEDPFYQLFQTVNILQSDIGEVIDELKTSNLTLEEQVRLRTAEISEKEANLRSLLFNFKAPIWLIDKDYKLIDFNPVFADNMKKLFGVDLRHGNSVFEGFPEQVAQFWKERYDKCLAGETHEYTEEYDFGSERKTFTTLTYPTLHNSEIAGVGILAFDISELQKSRNDLKKQNKALRKLNAELDSFVYRSSHDMRAPISSVLGLINLAREEQDISQKDKYLEMMSDSIEKLDEFIHDIINISKNTHLEPTYKVVNLQGMVDQTISELRHLDHEQTIEFETIANGSPTCITDAFRLSIVLKNIIANSINYRDHSRSPKITIRIEVNAKEATIVVEDNGKGIDPKLQGKVFEMFFRGTDQSKGTGLGLYIAREAVDRLNGDIAITSKLGVGTTTTIIIPNNGQVQQQVASAAD